MRTADIVAFSSCLAAVLSIGAVRAADAALPGQSMADSHLEKDTLKLLMGMDGATDRGCHDRKISNREIVSSDAAIEVERWTVDRCGTPVQYTVTYTHSSESGTLIGVTPPTGDAVSPSREAMTLPKEYSVVWYRPGNRGMSFKAYTASGKLVIRETEIVFGEGSASIRIGIDEIHSLESGRMSADIVNDWVIVRFGDPEKVAGFKDGSHLGLGRETNAIYQTIKAARDQHSAPRMD